MAELGVRYKCYKCDVKFYDLNKPRPICPACGEDQGNKEVKQTYRGKKRRSYAKMEPDLHPIQEEGVETADTYEEGCRHDPDQTDEYASEKEDLAPEGDAGEDDLEIDE